MGSALGSAGVGKMSDSLSLDMVKKKLLKKERKKKAKGNIERI